MIETPLRSMVTYIVWTPHIWALHFLDYHHSWTNKHCVTFPFVSRYRIRPRSDYRYLHIGFLPCYRRTLFYSFVSLWPRDLVTHLQGYCHNSTEWAQRVSILYGRTNPALDQSPHLLPFRYPRHTFMIAHLRCNGWCTQSTLPAAVIMKDLTV
jgi:hypothetical protein